MALGIIGYLILGTLGLIVSYVLMPKPKQPKPPSVDDIKAPTTDAGRPIPLVFGSMTIKGVNLLGEWDKEIRTRKSSAGGKK